MEKLLNTCIPKRYCSVFTAVFARLFDVSYLAGNFVTPTRTKNRLFFLFKTGINARGLQWQEVSNHLKLQANHIPFLKRVAELHGALYD